MFVYYFTIITMTSKILLFVSLFLVAANARSIQEIRLFFMKQGIDCSAQFPVTGEEMQMLKDHKVPDTGNSRCLLNCVFRKIKWMDAKGNFDADSAFNMVEKDHLEDPAKMEGSKKLMETCKRVNDETVSDGEKGCERAALLTKCFVEEAPKHGLKVQ